ncbi:MAG: hypothetical protein DRH24_17855, partial [Deltaproteobacteria bacterium]
TANGKDYAPTLVAQIKHMPIFIDLHGKGDRITKDYVDKYCTDKLAVIYKIPYRINFGSEVSLPGCTYTRKSTEEPLSKYLYIIHPVQSLSELYLDNARLNTHNSFYTKKLMPHEIALLARDNVPIRPSTRMMGMSLPFTSTESLYEVWRVISSLHRDNPLLQNYFASFADLSSVHDIRFGGVSVLKEAYTLMSDMLEKKLCKGCPNSLICSISSNESVRSRNYEVQQTQQTCVENYFKHFFKLSGIKVKTYPQKVLMAQYVENAEGTVSSTEGYITQPCLHILANSLRSAEKPVGWLTAKIKSGSFFGGMSLKGSSNGKVHTEARSIGSIGKSRGIGSPKEAALNTPIHPGSSTKIGSYYPENYDSRKEIQGGMPYGVEVSKPFTEAIMGLLSEEGLGGGYSSTLHPGGFTEHVWRYAPDTNLQVRRGWLTKVLNALAPLLSVVGGKHYLELDIAFTNETVYQAIARTTKDINHFLVSDPGTNVVLNLKELKYIAAKGCLKLGEALTEAMEVAHRQVYLQASMTVNSKVICPHRSSCVLGGVGTARDECPIETLHGGLANSDLTKRVFLTSNPPCTQAITMETDLVQLGPDKVYGRLSTLMPKLDESIKILAVYIDECLSQKEYVGGAYTGGLNLRYKPGFRSDKNTMIDNVIFSSIALHIHDGQVKPIVLDPEKPLSVEDTVASLLRLKKYAPEYFHKALMEVIQECITHQDEDAGVWQPQEWLINMPDKNVLPNNTKMHSRTNDVHWGVSLMADPSYQIKIQTLSNTQIMYYEMIRARLLAPLAPLVIDNLTVEVGVYPAGLLRVQKGILTEDVVGLQHVISVLLYRQVTDGMTGTEESTTACKSMAQEIYNKIHNRKALFTHAPTDKYLKDSSVIGYSISGGPQGGVQDIHVYRTTSGMLKQAERQCKSYPTIDLLVGLTAYTERALTANRLQQLLGSTVDSDVLHKALRTAIYSYDFAQLLELYWVENGVATSNLGMLAVIIGNYAHIVPDDNAHIPKRMGYNKMLSPDMPSEKYINRQIAKLLAE